MRVQKGSYEHRVVFHSNNGCYICSWTQDLQMPNILYRTPSSRSFTTDEKGARRFCKKWKLDFENQVKRI